MCHLAEAVSGQTNPVPSEIRGNLIDGEPASVAAAL